MPSISLLLYRRRKRWTQEGGQHFTICISLSKLCRMSCQLHNAHLCVLASCRFMTHISFIRIDTNNAHLRLPSWPIAAVLKAVAWWHCRWRMWEVPFDPRRVPKFSDWWHCAIVEKICRVMCGSRNVCGSHCWTGSAYHFRHLALREERSIVGMWMECAVMLRCEVLKSAVMMAWRVYGVFIAAGQSIS